MKKHFFKAFFLLTLICLLHVAAAQAEKVIPKPDAFTGGRYKLIKEIPSEYCKHYVYNVPYTSANKQSFRAEMEEYVEWFENAEQLAEGGYHTAEFAAMAITVRSRSGLHSRTELVCLPLRSIGETRRLGTAMCSSP